MPEAVADHNLAAESGHGSLRHVDSADLRVRVQHCEIVAVGSQELDALGVIASGEISVCWEHARDILENSRALLKVPQLGNGHADIPGIRAAEVVVDSDELLGLLER